MKSAGRVVDELRAMYKERADIEAEYSKRLSKLARQNFGKDETGSMRAAIEVVRMEIDQISKTHADLSSLIKKDLEGQMAEYLAKVQNQRKASAAQIEKLYKQKQTQESYVNKSKDKYEQDCIKINGYTAQSSLVQGRDLEKVTTKLDKAQSTVSANDKDYQNFVRALKDTTHRWNSEWKTYLDQCQDIEEERLEFLKGNLWNYANAISAVCVADDESCERVRVSLETCEAPRDIVDFIQRAGTGSAIADPPEYINYSKGQPPPARPTFKSANFQRSTTRQTPYLPMGPPVVAPTAPPANIVPPPSNRGNSSGGSGPPESMIQQSQSRRDSMGPPTSQSIPRLPMQEEDVSSSFRPPPGAVGLPGMTSNASQATVTSPIRDETIESSVPPPQSQSQQPPAGETPRADKRMSARNFMARTPSMNKSIRGQGTDQVPPSETTSTVSTNRTTIDHQEDPIAKALANLRMRPGGKSPGPQSPGPGASAGQPAPPSSKQYGSIGPNRAVSPSYHNEPRARSPSAAFMQEPTERSTSPMPVEEVLGQYHQHFPGERRALSRQNSSASRTSRMSVQQVPPPDRSKSPGPSADGGFAGVGARGRSPSPQPFHRGQTPSQQLPPQQQQQPPRQQQPAYQQQQQPLQQRQGAPQGRPAQAASMNQIPPPRSTTPLGIALDASGSVTHDQMADEFIKRSGSVGPGQVGPSASQPAIQRVQSQFSSAHGRAPSPLQSGAATPGHGYTAAPPIQQQHSYSSHQSQPSMASQYSQQPPQQQAPPAGQYAYQQQQQGYAPSQTPVPAAHHPQDSMSSLGRQAGYAAFQSPYNQTPAAAMTPQPSTPGPAPAAAHGYGQPPQQQMQQPPPIGGQYGQVSSLYQAPVQESPAASYMHQYQQSHHGPPTPGPPTPAPGAQQGGYHQQGPPPPQQQQQQQAPQWGNQQQPPPATNGMSYANQGHYPAQTQQAQPQPQQPNMAQMNPPPRSNTQTAPPTGQFSDTGKPILFYVKALYDYGATTDEEFGFTAGDVIAVWETNPDGWWQGELLDDARRRAGANTFPSNFVSLLN